MFSFRRAIGERFTNPMLVSREIVRDVLNRQRYPIFQFSHPCYSPKLLQNLNDLCIEFGDAINIRFYGHPNGSFDGRVLDLLPNVQNLTIDCMSDAKNLKSLFKLERLKHLWFEVESVEDHNMLSSLKLSALKSLFLGQNKKRNFDLTHLKHCTNVESLGLVGHTNNIQAISKLPLLNDLTLCSLPKRTSLEFINSMPSLKHLEIVLGGRSGIAELNHASLEELHLVRVLGLTELGSLSRFVSLRKLQVEDQPKLEKISLGNGRLIDLKLLNCSNLKTVEGLEASQHLFQIRVYRTQLPLDELLEKNWPKTLKFLALYSKSEKWNKLAEKRVRERGYRMMTEN